MSTAKPNILQEMLLGITMQFFRVQKHVHWHFQSIFHCQPCAWLVTKILSSICPEPFPPQTKLVLPQWLMPRWLFERQACPHLWLACWPNSQVWKPVLLQQHQAPPKNCGWRTKNPTRLFKIWKQHGQMKHLKWMICFSMTVASIFTRIQRVTNWSMCHKAIMFVLLQMTCDSDYGGSPWSMLKFGWNHGVSSGSSRAGMTVALVQNSTCTQKPNWNLWNAGMMSIFAISVFGTFWLHQTRINVALKTAVFSYQKNGHFASSLALSDEARRCQQVKRFFSLVFRRKIFRTQN